MQNSPMSVSAQQKLQACRCCCALYKGMHAVWVERQTHHKQSPIQTTTSLSCLSLSVQHSSKCKHVIPNARTVCGLPLQTAGPCPTSSTLLLRVWRCVCSCLWEVSHVAPACTCACVPIPFVAGGDGMSHAMVFEEGGQSTQHQNPLSAC